MGWQVVDIKCKQETRQYGSLGYTGLDVYIAGVFVSHSDPLLAVSQETLQPSVGWSRDAKVLQLSQQKIVWDAIEGLSEIGIYDLNGHRFIGKVCQVIRKADEVGRSRVTLSESMLMLTQQLISLYMPLDEVLLNTLEDL